MATVQNNTPYSLAEVTLSYQLTVPNWPANEELPGQRVHFSLSGRQREWNLAGRGTFGIPQAPAYITIALPVNGLAPGATMYILWADDNGDPTDWLNQIDNVTFSAVPVPEPSLGMLGGLASILVGLRRRRC